MKSPVAMEINEAQVAESSEEPEEGEIIDDFEVISDDSITFSPQKQGKSLEGNSSDLRALSLSSLTDLEVVVDRNQSFPHHSRSKIKRKRQQQQHGGQVAPSNLSPSRLPSNLELEEISPSLSDASLSPDRQIRKKRHLHYHKHARKRRKIHSHRLSADTGSESDEEIAYSRSRLKKQLRAAISTDVQESHINSKLKRQLKAAISVNFKESHKNSLHDRLLAMTKKDINTSELPSDTKVANITVDDSLLQEIKNQNSGQSSEEQNDDDMLDSELMELRLEALKTALKNKYKDKQKNLKSETHTLDAGTEINKENTNSNATKNTNLDSVNKATDNNNEPIEENESIPQSPEDDEDVLRALLLASMSNKITKKVAKLSESIIPTKKTIINAKTTKLVNNAPTNKIMNNPAPKLPTNIQPFKINNIKNKAKANFALILNNKKLDKRVQNLPKVKPLIINVNSDSDTEDDLFPIQSNTTDKNVKITEIVPVIEIAPKLSDTVDNPNTKVLKNCILNNAEIVKDIKKTHSESVNTESAIKESEIHISKESTSTKVISIENKIPLALTPSVIECSVEKFLREQRAKVDAEKEAEMSKTIIITRDLNNDELIVGSKTPLSGVANAQGMVNSKNLNNIIITRNLANGAKTVDLTSIRGSNKAPNSAVKLLPKNKQIEYQKLLMRLRNAEKKIEIKRPRVRRSSQRLSTSETNNNFTPTKTNILNLPKHKINKPKEVQNSTPEEPRIKDLDKKTVISPETTSPGSGESSMVLEERKSDALLLHNTLKQMQQKVNGRSHIQEKYNCLKPLMKKINEVSKEQKHWNQQVKKLLEELAEAKKNQERVHQEMNDSVKQLVEKKKQIDKDSVNPIPVTAEHLFPEKNNPIYPTLQISTVTLNKVKHTQNLASKYGIIKDGITKISTTLSPITINQNKLMSPKKFLELADGKNNTTSDSDLNIGDPNDIEMIISKENKKKSVRKSFLFSKSRQDMSRKATLQSKINPKRMQVNNDIKQQNKNVGKTRKTQVKEILPTIISESMKTLENYSEQLPTRPIRTPINCVKKIPTKTKNLLAIIKEIDQAKRLLSLRSVGTAKNYTEQNKIEQGTHKNLKIKTQTKQTKIMTLEEQAKKTVENKIKNRSKTLELTNVTNELQVHSEKSEQESAQVKEVSKMSTVRNKTEKANIPVEIKQTTNTINKGGVEAPNKGGYEGIQQPKIVENVDKIQKDKAVNVDMPEHCLTSPDNVAESSAEVVKDNLSIRQCVNLSKFKYVSPLDHVKRHEVINPYSIMCPFEVDGTCKDPECSYKHFLPK